MKIKFRTWDKYENKMIYNVQSAYDYFGGIYLTSFGECLDDKNDFDSESEYYSTMMFTGWKDRYGEEIYIGDLVYIYTENNDEEDGLFEVVWDENECCVAFEGDHVVYTGQNISGKDVEVVCNKYEKDNVEEGEDEYASA